MMTSVYLTIKNKLIEKESKPFKENFLFCIFKNQLFFVVFPTSAVSNGLLDQTISLRNEHNKNLDRSCKSILL